MSNSFYADVAWTPGDIQFLVPELSEEEAEDWLCDNHVRIADAMTEHGWQVIRDLLAADGIKITGGE